MKIDEIKKNVSELYSNTQDIYNFFFDLFKKDVEKEIKKGTLNKYLIDDHFIAVTSYNCTIYMIKEMVKHEDLFKTKLDMTNYELSRMDLDLMWKRLLRHKGGITRHRMEKQIVKDIIDNIFINSDI